MPLSLPPPESCPKDTTIKPCPLWGTEQFNGCKLCRRERKAPLKFRSDRHKQCNPCMGTLRMSDPAQLGKVTKFQEVLARDPDAYAAHCKAVEAWQDVMNSGVSPAKKRPRLSKSSTEAQNDVDSRRDVSVSTENKNQLLMRTNVGVFWPEELYRKETGSKPVEDDLYLLGSATGVLRDSKLGCPTGCSHVFNDQILAVKKVEGVTSSSTALRDGEVPDVFDHYKSKVALQVGESESGNLALKEVDKKRKNDEELDDLWEDAARFAYKAGADESKTPKKGRRGGGTESKDKKPKQAKEKGASSPAPKARKRP